MSLVYDRDHENGIRRLFEAWVGDPLAAARICMSEKFFPVPATAFPDTIQPALHAAQPMPE